MKPTRSGRGRPLTITVSGVLGTIGVFFVAAVCIRLGFWQLDRFDQRDTRNARVAERLALPAVPLATSVDDTAGLGYRRVRVHGALDLDRSIVLAGRSHSGAPGVHLLTPLRLEDGTAVIVNRGWVPSPDGASIDLDAFHADSIDGEGIIVPFPAIDGDAGEAGSTVAREFQRVWFRVDATALRRQFPYPVPGFEVRLLPRSAAESSAPTRLEPPALDRGPHLGYAVQWFSFAAIFLIGWGAMVVRRTAPAPSGPIPK